MYDLSTRFHSKFQRTDPGLFTWSVLLCKDGRQGYGAFHCLMNYVPSVGQKLDITGLSPAQIGEPTGDLVGEVIGVTTAIQLAKLSKPTVEESSDVFGFAHTDCAGSLDTIADGFYVPIRQEIQVKIECPSIKPGK